jgi:hypothetical protein
VSPDSISWRVFKNPLSLFIGGAAAVIMELAEPRVRTGVWEHTAFRVDPIRRLRRTGPRMIKRGRMSPSDTCMSQLLIDGAMSDAPGPIRPFARSWRFTALSAR